MNSFLAAVVAVFCADVLYYSLFSNRRRQRSCQHHDPITGVTWTSRNMCPAGHFHFRCLICGQTWRKVLVGQ